MTTTARVTDLETRILRAFSRRARKEGPSAVVMADLARDLGISTKTLYRAFPSKAELVSALLRRWVERLDGQLDAPSDEAAPVLDQLLRASEVWRANRRRFGATFWAELEHDYPSSYVVFADARRRFREQAVSRLAPRLRPGIPLALAVELFDVTLAHVVDSAVQTRLGLDQRTAVRTAVRIWANGTIDSTDASRMSSTASPTSVHDRDS